MSTLADIRRAAEADVRTCVDSDCPEGYFVATTKILGVTGSYLLAGEFDDPRAVIVGRIEYSDPSGAPLASHRAYAGAGLKGGTALDSYDSEDAFRKMAPPPERPATMSTEPVRVEIIIETRPCTDVVELDRAEWDAATPSERRAILDGVAQDAVSNAGGYGWNLLDPADEVDIEDEMTSPYELVSAGFRLAPDTWLIVRGDETYAELHKTSRAVAERIVATLNKAG